MLPSTLDEDLEWPIWAWTIRLEVEISNGLLGRESNTFFDILLLCETGSNRKRRISPTKTILYVAGRISSIRHG